MGPSALVRGFLVLALGFAFQVDAQCARSIQAQEGDTCASLAALTGITVAQFLKSNPSVSSCSALTPGANYCVDGVATGTPVASTSKPAQSSGPLKVSTDGTCGTGITCAGSSFGNCCSQHGFCGSSTDHCGDGCQPSLGTCGSNPVTSNPITKGPTQTVTVTSTVIVTSTRATVVTQTSTAVVTNTVATTRTVVQSAVATATVTATVRTTSTETATATVRTTATVLQTSIVTLTSIVVTTSTRTALATSTVVVTGTTRVTSVATVIETLTTIKTISVTGGCNIATTIWGPSSQRPTPTTVRLTTVTNITPGRPSPYLPGSSRNCRYYDQIQQGDTCRGIAQRNDVTLLDFYNWNPSVSANKPLLGGLLCTLELVLSGLCQINCDDLWPGYFVCVGE